MLYDVAPDVRYDRDGQPASFWGLRGSASLSARELTLTVVNPHVREPRETRIILRGGRVSALSATTVTSQDIHAHNTFDQPDALVPQTKSLQTTDAAMTYVFLPASVTKRSFSLM